MPAFSVTGPSSLNQQPRPVSRDERLASRPRSPTKAAFSKLTNINMATRTNTASRDGPLKKQKSGTNLAGLLRPKSLRNLHKLATDDGTVSLGKGKDKENMMPASAGPRDHQAPTPIFAQFTVDSGSQAQVNESADEPRRSRERQSGMEKHPEKQRPTSFQIQPHIPAQTQAAVEGDKPDATRARSRFMSALPGYSHRKSKSTTALPSALDTDMLDRKDIDRHLEAMLDRRNIPENQRYKMRNLSDTIKMDFIRHDWAEMQATKTDHLGTSSSMSSAEHVIDNSNTPSATDIEEEKPKRNRGRSFTFTRGRKDDRGRSSSKKPKGEGTLGRHFRSKSSDSVASQRSLSGGSTSSTSLLNKLKSGHTPADYVAYLRKVQKPELVEVGKLHKLRLLLRNETVAWIEDFIQQGGMKEIVGLLRRIMDVEWREEHEDALLHENLLCLKALSTTARGMQYLHTIHAELFPKLLGMLFDPEKKGPSEFTTRNIVTSVFFAYIETASSHDRQLRAASLLKYLRDPELDDAKRPLPFVMEMRQERPYRVWNKEVVSVTKEVFWIFLHHLNVVSRPSEDDRDDANATGGGPCATSSYMDRHFPRQRPPVPAAPYVGGVEWDATNYLASHLDLLNAVLACIPNREDRNSLRGQMRISGWERCLGGSLRLCKEKFYGSVHDGLRTWVAAAAEDGWDVKDVRYGPAPETRSPPKKIGGGQKKKTEEAPKLDFPKLDMALDKQKDPKGDAWL